MPDPATQGAKPVPKRNRTEFVRTEVPPWERVSSLVIVFLLIGTGAAIWIKGRHFDPGVFALRTDALKSTENAVEGKTGTARSDIGATEGSAARVPTAATATAAPPTPVATASAEGGDEGANPAKPAAPATGEPLEIPLPGLKPMGNTEFYNADNLFEKIDGRSPAYEAFNVQQLRCRSFGLDGTKGSYVDVYEYRFDTPVDTFGLFAQERDPNGKPLDFAADGYASEMGFFFRQGAVYVQIICSDQNADTLKAARAVAENLAKAIPVDDSGLAARRKLPSDSLIPTSITFVSENALGQSFLNEVFQADYNFSGQKVTFFVMTTNAPAAADAWHSFLVFSGKYGGTASQLPAVSGAQVFEAQNFGKSKIIYQRDGELGGVIDAVDPNIARQFIEKYLAGQMH